VKKLLIFVFVAVVLLFGLLLLFYKKAPLNNLKKSSAASSTKAISVKADWDRGTLNNILSSESGNIQILDKGISNLLYDIGQNHPDQISVSSNPERKLAVVDNNDSTSWYPDISYSPGSPECTTPIPDTWWQVDLGEIHTDIKQFRYKLGTPMPQLLQISTDSMNFITYQTIYYSDGWDSINVSEPISARYIRLYAHFVFPFAENICPDYQSIVGFEILSGGTATHVSAPTQIDGGENFFQWQTFTPTQTVPANTSVSYRFRTSPDASNWTSWSAPQTPTSGNALDISSLVTSKSGDTYYRYLQVETTLSNTDGTSTPTVDSYTIGYHTNRKPNKPIAQTAVIRQ